MLASNGSVGPSNNSGGNTATLLTVNGIIPNQQMSGQHGNRPGPVFTPFFPNTTFTTFQSPFSGPTSVVPCITSPNGGTIFQGPGGQFPFNMTGSMLLTQPQSIINGTPISYQHFNHPVSVANSSNGTTVVLTANDMCISSSGQLPIFQNGAIVSIASSNNTQTTSVSMNNNINNNSVVDSTAPSIKCKPEVKPVVPLGTVANSNSAPESNIANLEKAQFYRDFILEAIDKLRDRKARPDMERISCLLRRQHNIQPSDTQICLTRLAETGSILCVDYKGNLSYRNPAKWRKTATSAVGIANKPNISKRLIEAVRSLIPEGGDKSQSFTIFQIEQAIKNQKPPQNSEGENDSNAPTNTLLPELTGSGLKISLDKEVNYGGLAKLHDGRYVLDEHGEKKHRSIMFNFNRRPFSGKLAANGTFGKPPIAPALDSVGGKPYSVFSLTPGRPLARRPPISTGKRGRPPSIKNKKMLTSCSQQPILPAPSDSMLEKRMKLESVPVTPTQTTTFVPIDGTVMVSATPMQTLSLTPAQQVTPQVSVSGGPNAAPTAAMMMYPGIYSHPTTTLFAVTPETTSLVGSTFQPTDAAGATLPVTLNTSNTVVANSATPTGSIVVVRPTATLATTTVTTPAKETQKPVVAITSIKPSPSEESSQTPGPSKNEEICCRCQQNAGGDAFLVCQDCGINAHPKCLDFSPEATAAARQNNWQCANCKPCSICKVQKPESVMLICDACDKGYHDTCHNPAVTDRKSADQTAPWICSSCQGLGYHVKQDEPKIEQEEIISVLPPGSEVPSLLPTAAPTSETVSKVDDTQTNPTAKVEKSTSAEVASCTDEIPEESELGKSKTKTSPSKEASTSTVENQEQMEVDDSLPPNMGTPHHDILEIPIINTRPENVRRWTASQVADWLKEQGNYEREADIFRENEIDGCALMLLKDYNLLIDAKIKIGPAVKILEKVRLLQASVGSRGL
ncbi:unnamed protein product [Hymenolepis diminuta]|uniref:PHD-type domain-containing protein n=1 Tax=Hymenolepis diminuta TaxID=6216 RepID=A0A564Z8H8_HYMDI|nr:unnamed protein product [Hymenolepis diminuta]